MIKRPKEPIQCWERGEDHLLRNCPHRKENTINIQNIKEATIVDDVLRIIPKIYDAFKDSQVDHQSAMVEVKGKIAKQFLSILIDPRSSCNYVTAKVVEIYSFKK